MASIQSGSGNGANLTIDPTSSAARATIYDQAGNVAIVDELQQLTTIAGMVNMSVNDLTAVATRADRLGSTAIASNNTLFLESFEGTTLHAGRWTVAATTMAATLATATGLVINSGAITTINTGYLASTAKAFLKSMRAPLQCKFRARLNTVANSVMEIGFGNATVFNTPSTTGAYWQVTAGGVIQPAVVFNGTVITGTDVSSLLNKLNYYTYDIISDDDEVIFIVQDTSTSIIISRQSLKLSASGIRILSTTQIPGIIRLYNTGSAPASAPQLIVTDFNVLSLDINQMRPWPHVLAAINKSAIENPFTGAQNAAWANSAEPANAALSNTAAGYTTLGGKFQFAAVAGAATDFALFGFQVPVPANFNITGVDIEAWNTGAAVATSATVLTWALGVGATAVSLAGTLTRVGLGAQDFQVGAAIGGRAQRLSKTFTTPLFCPSGRFIHVILRMPVGTATASQVIAGMVNIEGYTD